MLGTYGVLGLCFGDFDDFVGRGGAEGAELGGWYI